VSAGVASIEGKNIYLAGGTDIALADGGTGASLTDPNADKIMFWDDTAGAVKWLGAGDSIVITDTTMDTIQDIRTSASPTFNQGNFTTLHSTTLLVDHIGEHTASHNVVFDNPLFVEGNSATVLEQLRINNQNSTAGSTIGSSISFKNISTEVGRIKNFSTSYGASDWKMQIGTLGSLDLMTLTQAGYVGIGATSPGSKLHVYGGGTYQDGLRLEFSGASGNGWNWAAGSDANLYFGYGTTASLSHKAILYSGTGDFKAYGSLIAPGSYSSTVGATNRDLYVDNTGLLGYVSSSERYKENITDIGDTSWIYDLRPVNFDYKDKSKGVGLSGFIAEEVSLVNPKIVSYERMEIKDEDGNITYGEDLNTPETVNYGSPILVASMIKEIQKLRNRIKVLETKMK